VTRLGLEVRNLQRQWFDLPDLPFVGPSRPVRLEGRDECSWYLAEERIGCEDALSLRWHQRRRLRHPQLVEPDQGDAREHQYAAG